MKQKMSRVSGAGCAAAAFANGPGAELLLCAAAAFANGPGAELLQ